MGDGVISNMACFDSQLLPSPQARAPKWTTELISECGCESVFHELEL